MARRFNRDRTKSFGRFIWKRFVDDKCFETAGALSYTTLVSLVPLMVAALAMFSVFPLFENARDTLLNFVFRNFVPAAGHHVQEALNVFASNASGLTGISVLVMLFSALSMMVSIEDRLNRIWRVQQPRGWVSRLLLYWAALTLGPILVVGGIAVSSYLTALPMLRGTAVQLGVGGLLLRGLPFVVTFVTLWLLYAVVPNRYVAKRDATIGALLGAVLFELARWGFRLFVRDARTYQQIYGALAAIPIFLLWIYLSWVIVILGASIAASISSFEYQAPERTLPEGSEFIGLMVVLRYFVEAQRVGGTVDPVNLRAREPYLRSALVDAYFEDLQQADLIRGGESGGWLLSRSLDSTDLLRIYRHADYRLPLQPVEQVAALGIELPPELLQMLSELSAVLTAKLGMRLDQIYPPAAGTAAGTGELPA